MSTALHIRTWNQHVGDCFVVVRDIRSTDSINIGLSIVQGSCIGHTLYIAMKSDLYSLSKLNNIFKYADDTTLLVPEQYWSSHT